RRDAHEPAPVEPCVPDADATETRQDTYILQDSDSVDTLPTQTEVRDGATVYDSVAVEPLPIALPEPVERTCPSWREVGPVYHLALPRLARVANVREIGYDS